MKKIYIALLLIALVGCTNNEKTMTLNYRVAVIETASNIRKSKITYYDQDLKETSSTSLKYANFGTHFSDLPYADGEVYIVPEGLAKESNDRMVASIHLKSGAITEYGIDRVFIEGVNADEQYIYAASNQNFITYITQYHKETQEVQEASIPDLYTSLIIPYKDKVFAFLYGDSQGTFTSVLHVYNLDMSLHTKIDVSMIGGCPRHYTIIDNTLLFSSLYNSNEEENTILGCLDLDTLTLDSIALNHTKQSTLLTVQDKVLVAHINYVIPEQSESSISMVDIQTKEIQEYDLQYTPFCMAVQDTMLYVITTDSYLISYDIANNFKITNKVKYTLSKDCYISGIFVSAY